MTKIYKLMMLLNTLEKTLKSVIVRKISWITEIYQLLFKTLFNKKKRMLMKHVIHILMKVIQRAWNFSTSVISFFMFNVSEAFDNMSHQRLLHNLRKQQISLTLTDWIDSFLQKWISIFKLLEFESEFFSIFISILQESSLSFILYLFYNANLFNINNRSNLWTVTANWIDNVDFTVSDVFTKSNCQILQTLYTEIEIWTCQHTLIFIFIKYKFIHFINKLNIHNISVILILKFHKISFTKICWVLNIILNLQLKFEVYV